MPKTLVKHSFFVLAYAVKAINQLININYFIMNNKVLKFSLLIVIKFL